MESKTYQHCLTPGLVNSLIKMIKAVQAKGQNSVHPLWDAKLDAISYCNLQKMRYFSLIAQDKNKSGHWLITERGGKFLRNELAIPKQVKTCDNRIVEKSAETITISEVYHNCFKEDYWQKNFEIPTVLANPLGLKL